MLTSLLAAVLLTASAGAADAWWETTAERPTTHTRALQETDDFGQPTGDARERKSVAHQIVLWIPNRLFDALDIVRLRARLGPGLSLSVRATDYVDVFAGAHVALYVGLPGPRGKPSLNLPIGAESNVGVEVSVFDAAASIPYMNPTYGKTEFGVGVHALVIGVDVGFDPVELVDFITGILFIDIRHDDL